MGYEHQLGVRGQTQRTIRLQRSCALVPPYLRIWGYKRNQGGASVNKGAQGRHDGFII